MKNNISRRTFIKSSAVAAAGTSLFSLTGPSVSGNVIGANDRVRIALSGAGGRGFSVAREFVKLPNVEVVCVVDPDEKRRGNVREKLVELQGNTMTEEKDSRVMLEDKNIDAVIVASCNHWHALTTIWACQAGKDVYVEKPCSQNLYEGRKMVEAATKYKRFVQHGTQRRSSDGWAKAAAAAHSGKYGKIVAAKAYAHRPRGPLGFKPVSDPPENLDWDLWLGPVPKQGFHRNLVHYNWHWFWDTGNGEIGNNGVHYFDTCLWVLGEKHPDSVISFGARFVDDPENQYRDQAQTPTIHFALYDFDGIPLIFESCNLAGPKDQWKPREETEIIMEDGIIVSGFFIRNDGKREGLDVEYTPVAPGGPMGNLVNAIRNRDSVSINAPVAKGHYSAAVCHWGNAAYRAGQRESLAVIRERMGDNPVLNESIERVFANLKNVLQDRVKIEDIPFQISPKMRIDKEKECFIDHEEANKFLTREPRPPFAVPTEV